MFRPDDWKIALDHNNRALDKLFDHVSRFLPEDHKLKKSKLLLSVSTCSTSGRFLELMPLTITAAYSGRCSRRLARGCS